MPPKNILNERFFFRFYAAKSKKQALVHYFILRAGAAKCFYTTPQFSLFQFIKNSYFGDK